tara:strand:+ start:772 stop:1083 length:312 start_codon:yes stop_codon:yes gene_type:complete
MPTKQTINKIKEIMSGCLLLYLDTNHPEKGSPKRELMGIAKSIVPSSAWFKLKNVLIVGIREAHDAKQSPDKKKYTPKAIRCLTFNSMLKIKIIQNPQIYKNR